MGTNSAHLPLYHLGKRRKQLAERLLQRYFCLVHFMAKRRQRLFGWRR
jgi:hypothetical protein